MIALFFKSRYKTKHTRSTTKCLVTCMKSIFHSAHLKEYQMGIPIPAMIFSPCLKDWFSEQVIHPKQLTKNWAIGKNIFQCNCERESPTIIQDVKKYVMCSFFCEIDSWYFSQFLPIFHQPYSTINIRIGTYVLFVSLFDSLLSVNKSEPSLFCTSTIKGNCQNCIKTVAVVIVVLFVQYFICYFFHCHKTIWCRNVLTSI